MSDYGADENPDLVLATDLAYTKGFLPLDKTNVMQWTYPDDVTVRKIANKQDKSNVLFKFAPEPPPPVIPPDLDPVAAGDACALCWGNGEPFGVGETPVAVIAVIQDVKKGPAWAPFFGEPPNGEFELTQDVGLPCKYVFEDADYVITLIFGPGNATFIVQNKPTMVLSFNGLAAECQTFFTTPFLIIFDGGAATVFIPPII